MLGLRSFCRVNFCAGAGLESNRMTPDTAEQSSGIFIPFIARVLRKIIGTV
jgi:hypothetical protein